MIAYPIPRGATVIATPTMRGMPISPPLPVTPSIMQHSPGFNPEARPFFPPSAPQESSQTLASPKPGKNEILFSLILNQHLSHRTSDGAWAG